MPKPITRRTALAGAASSLILPRPALSASTPAPTAREMFAAIKRASGQPWDPNPTDDRIIFGDRATPVTGIATCFFASMDVLREAKRAGLNYVIPHEASFYERYDDFAESALPDSDPVLTAKKRFVLDNNMVIQRMHAHAHSRPGDAIMTGLLQRLGWLEQRISESPILVRVPSASAIRIGRHIMERCGRRTMSMFGDPNAPVSTIAVSAGMPGENAQIALMEVPGVDAIMLGEVREPEVLGYAQDLAASRPLVVYMAGHTAEDLGMRNVAEWLQTVFPSLPCRWIPTIDPYTDPV